MATRWSLSLLGCLLLTLISVHFCDGADPSDKATFHDTHHLLWKDCGDTNSWFRFNAFDVTPSPLHIPGNATITIHGQNGNTAFYQNVALVVTIEKHLLGRWMRIPCTGPMTPTDQRVGSCTYREPCTLPSILFPQVCCPTVFVQQGLTCPLTFPAYNTLKVNNLQLTFPAPRPECSWIQTGEYYIKLVMYETGQSIARMCLEAYINLYPY